MVSVKQRSHVLGGRRGQSMVELAIALWVFLFVGFAVFEGGMLAWNAGTLQHAVEEGARVALRPSTADATAVKTVVQNAGVGLNLQPADIIVGFCPVSGSCDSLCSNVTAYGAPTRPAGRQIRVCATYRYTPLFLNLIIGSPTLTLRRQAQVRSE
jgi:Flp pilus assembly protein TadG